MKTNIMSNENIANVTCVCGLVIPDDKIDYSNRCEEGDDYYEVTAKCECGKEYECSEWGECESLTEAKKDLIEHMIAGDVLVYETQLIRTRNSTNI